VVVASVPSPSSPTSVLLDPLLVSMKAQTLDVIDVYAG
jgi:hypothetical protein